MIEKSLPFQTHDPQFNGPQYLEDLATGYWYSEALFTAVELGIFTLLEPEGKRLCELVDTLDLDSSGLQRFLQALCVLELLDQYEGIYVNTWVSQEFLVKGKDNYQGESILWRKCLFPNWRSLSRCLKKGGRVKYPRQDEGQEKIVRRIRRYGRAMDCVAKNKVKEFVPFLANRDTGGEILDVGSGPGTISIGLLEHFPDARATLMDIPEVLDYARERLEVTEFSDRFEYCSANILEPWPLSKEHYDLVILSNIVHAYAEAEIGEVLDRAVACLKPDGMILIHDFFHDHCNEKAALFDLNMFVNTYNGKVYEAQWLREQLKQRNLSVTELLPLHSDTALIFAAKDENCLQSLCLDDKSQLMARILRQGFSSVRVIPVEDIQIPGWTDLRCQFGCSSYGQPHCPPNSLSAEKTKELLKDYTYGLLLEGTPPTSSFQRLVLKAEREAFTGGYYKAFALWAGPCTLCKKCNGEKGCTNTKEARPSMEASGIDVFSTVQKAGIALRPLAEGRDYVKYFAILLLE